MDATLLVPAILIGLVLIGIGWGVAKLTGKGNTTHS